MKFMRDFIQNANVLNVALAIIILAFGAGIAISAIRIRHSYTFPKIKGGEPAPVVQLVEMPQRMPTDYAVIGETNLFHPDRTIPVEKKAEVPRPEIVLFGTVIDTERLAFIEDKKNPVSTPSRGNRQRVVRKGEVVSGYTVTDIMKDRITLARGDDRITVMLSEPKRRGSDMDAQQPAEPAPPGRGSPQAKPPELPPRPGTAPNVIKPPQSPGPVPVGETPGSRTNRPGAVETGGQAPQRRTTPE